MEQNDYASKTYVEPHRERFRAVGCVPLQIRRPPPTSWSGRSLSSGSRGRSSNCYSNIGDEPTSRYLDEPLVLPFWERAAALDVPIYLHPHPAVERDAGAARLRGHPGPRPGLRPRDGRARPAADPQRPVRPLLHPDGDPRPHGRGLAVHLPRMEHRLRHYRSDTQGAHKQPVTHYLRHNFYLPSSDVFRTSTLLDAMLEISSYRITLSVDPPYERMTDLASWFDSFPISDIDRQKIGRDKRGPSSNWTPRPTADVRQSSPKPSEDSRSTTLKSIVCATRTLHHGQHVLDIRAAAIYFATGVGQP